MFYQDMEDEAHPRVPVWVTTFIFLRQEHDVRARARTDRVLFSPQVVRHIVDT